MSINKNEERQSLIKSEASERSKYKQTWLYVN